MSWHVSYYIVIDAYVLSANMVVINTENINGYCGALRMSDCLQKLLSSFINIKVDI